MQTQNFTSTILVDLPPTKVFNAINNVREWWTGDLGVEGNTNKLGDEFTYRYADIHYSKQKVKVLIPGKKIVWLVIESNLNFTKVKNEWTGTEISFEIFDVNGENNQTTVRFTHVGLIPEVECYTDCSKAWSSYINNSLKKFIADQKLQAI